MARLKSLQQLCEDRYSDPTIAQKVADDAIRIGTAERIVAGHLTLPSEQDAVHWHERLTGVAGLNPDQRRQSERVKALEQLVLEMYAHQEDPDPARKDAISERIAALKEGGD